ncbi:hypothetical protein DIPPA_30860 [Diplonema papillatum]|nr:hypothetical protein DIPPA_30860 [Diplonema papillatum]|eukprot:gene6365-9749_t
MDVEKQLSLDLKSFVKEVARQPSNKCYGKAEGTMSTRARVAATRGGPRLLGSGVWHAPSQPYATSSRRPVERTGDPNFAAGVTSPLNQHEPLQPHRLQAQHHTFHVPSYPVGATPHELRQKSLLSNETRRSSSAAARKVARHNVVNYDLHHDADEPFGAPIARETTDRFANSLRSSFYKPERSWKI